jgi:hypothetical protein
VPGVRRPRRGHRGVHPARHRRQHSHPAHSPFSLWAPANAGAHCDRPVPGPGHRGPGHRGVA